MLIVYDSMTGNVDRFVKKLGLRNKKIEPGVIVEEPFLLITYSIGFGEVPKKVNGFLTVNSHYLRGVIGSGNMIWGTNYCGAAEKIAKEFNVPLVHKFELSGTDKDVEKVQQEAKNIG